MLLLTVHNVQICLFFISVKHLFLTYWRYFCIALFYLTVIGFVYFIKPLVIINLRTHYSYKTVIYSLQKQRLQFISFYYHFTCCISTAYSVVRERRDELKQ